MVTYNDIYLRARRKLRAAGVTAHDLEARLIVGYASGKTREQLLSLSRFFVADNAIIRTVDEMIERRLGGEPVAYIVGEWEFFGHPIIVSNDVLIPRIDTEILAEQAIVLMKQRDARTRLLDLCTGSGCVGIAIALAVPNCRVVLADNSLRALAICRINLAKNRADRNAAAIEANAMEAPPALLGTFDAIVCNPPYIPTRKLKNLDPSVRDYEPVTALDGGYDGLDFFRSIAGKWRTVLKQDGHLILECGVGQARYVCDILKNNGFRDIITYLDTLGIERVVTGILNNE